MIWWWVGGLALGYLLGSIPFGYVIARLFFGVDIRRHGSGNIGFSNILRTLGWKPAVLVFLGDGLKGVAAVVVAGLSGDPSLALAGGVAAIAGHNWPVFLGFNGGRGVTTSLGVLVGLMPFVALAAALVWTVTVWLSRYISLGSLLAALTVPIAAWAFHYPGIYVLGTVMMAAFVIYRHIPNVKRLWTGTEFKIGQKTAKTSAVKERAGRATARRRPGNR